MQYSSISSFGFSSTSQERHYIAYNANFTKNAEFNVFHISDASII